MKEKERKLSKNFGRFQSVVNNRAANNSWISRRKRVNNRSVKLYKEVRYLERS